MHSMTAIIEIPVAINRRLKSELIRGRQCEIGGVLMGEHVAENTFRVIDFTVEHGTGTFSTFVRSLKGVAHALQVYFNRTQHDYCRFNYLGEWHSHPTFTTFPSSTDLESAQRIADDIAVGANFVVLLIVKLDSHTNIEGTAMIFRPKMIPEKADLVLLHSNDE